MPALPATLLIAVVVLLPWRAIDFIPGTPVHLTVVLLTVWAIATWLSCLRGRQLRVPYELAWPAAAFVLYDVVLTVKLVYDFHDSGAVFFPPDRPKTFLLLTLGAKILAGPIAFLTALQIAAGEPRVIRHALTAFALSAGVVLLAAGAAQLGGLLPPSVSVSAATLSLSSHHLSSNLFVLFLGGLAGAAMAVAPGNASRVRLLCGLAAAVCLSTLTTRLLSASWYNPMPLLNSTAATWWSSQSSAMSPWSMYVSLWFLSSAYILFVWLAARIAAKFWVGRVASERTTRLCFAGFTVVGMAGWLLFGNHHTPMPEILLGLMAGAAVPKRPFWEPTPVDRRALWLCLPVVLIIAYNAARVDIHNYADFRNYARAFRLPGESTMFYAEDGNDFLVYFDEHSPNETRTHYYRTLNAIKQDGPVQAMTSFERAVAQPDPRTTILPPLDEDEINELVVRLRDYCAALPPEEHTFIVERALIATGQIEQAIASLELQADAAAPATWGSWPTEPLADAIAAATGDGTGPVQTRLRQWPGERLLGLLTHWGAEVGAAPAEFPGNSLPLCAIGWNDGVESFVTSGSDTYIAAAVPASTKAYTPTVAEWSDWELSSPAGAWTAHLLAIQHGSAYDAAVLVIGLDGSHSGNLHSDWARYPEADREPEPLSQGLDDGALYNILMGRPSRPIVPRNVAIRVWLP